MDIDGRQIELDVCGLGIIFYSPKSASHITEGEDYLTRNYTTAEQVQAHVQDGSIVGFGTGSPGIYVLKFHEGYPDEFTTERAAFKLRLGLHCTGGCVCFKDLYELLDWSSDCPGAQTLKMGDGYYHVTLLSNPPPSGIIGDAQGIDIYLQPLNAFPPLAKEGIPTLC